MDSASELLGFPWIYVVLSVLVAVISVLCAYLYTRHKQILLEGQINEQSKLVGQTNDQAKAQGKDYKEAIAENIKGPDSWPTEEISNGKEKYNAISTKLHTQ